MIELLSRLDLRLGGWLYSNSCQTRLQAWRTRFCYPCASQKGRSSWSTYHHQGLQFNTRSGSGLKPPHEEGVDVWTSTNPRNPLRANSRLPITSRGVTTTFFSALPARCSARRPLGEASGAIHGLALDLVVELVGRPRLSSRNRACAVLARTTPFSRMSLATRCFPYL